jgi:hypothetical protein
MYWPIASSNNTEVMISLGHAVLLRCRWVVVKYLAIYRQFLLKFCNLSNFPDANSPTAASHFLA